MPLSFEERFWAKVEKTPTCWLWTGAHTPGRWAYGEIGVNGRLLLAHRVSYEMHVGPIPDGLQLDHLCRRTLCVNPTHLEPVTNRENTLRGLAPLRAGVRQREKTHCPRGHEYTVANTYRHGNKRHCRACWHLKDLARFPNARRAAE